MNPQLEASFLLLLSTSLSHSGTILQKADIRLTSLKPVSAQGNFVVEDQLSIGGVVCEYGIRGVYNVSMTYTIPAGSQQFVATAGISDYDNVPRDRHPMIVIYLDGDKVSLSESAASPEKNTKPVPIEISVKGHKSLRIDMDAAAALLEPHFVRGTPTKVNALQLVSPPDGKQVERGTVKLVWKPLEGARAYGVSLLCFSSDHALPDDAPRYWSFNTSATELVVNTSKLPTGKYYWTVVGFSDRKHIGEFSRDSLIQLVDKN